MSRQVVTIEKTGKNWKGMKVIGWLIIIGSFFSGAPEIIGIGVVLGILMLIIAKIGSWLNHG